MSDPKMENEFCMGGVTLRSLLESRDLLSVPMRTKFSAKDDKESCNSYCDAAAAFLGPNLWEKTLSDFKLEYIDLDDILGNGTNNDDHQQKLVENDVSKSEVAAQLLHLASSQEIANTHMQALPPCSQSSSLTSQSSNQHMQSLSPPPSPRMSSTPPLNTVEDLKAFKYALDCKFSPSDLALATPPGHDHFDPASTSLQDDDLKPQPMIKKSRKHFVPDDLKDDKYWARRRKNNIAAKRSREARRVKENQIVLRASYLEKENNTLKEDVLRLKAENDMLRNQLKKYKQ